MLGLRVGSTPEHDHGSFGTFWGKPSRGKSHVFSKVTNGWCAQGLQFINCELGYVERWGLEADALPNMGMEASALFGGKPNRRE